MKEIDHYPFLKAALEDIDLLSAISSNLFGTSRHAVVLMHDALEFILYECLLTLDMDVYKNGQNTIGLDAAIGQCTRAEIELPLIGTIRAIQKLRGDAKHHAQAPDRAHLPRILAEFRIIVSRLVHEHFASALGPELQELQLLSYHAALFQSYRKYRTHNWKRALRLVLGALIHKHRAIAGASDDFISIIGISEKALVATLHSEIDANKHFPISQALLASLQTQVTDIAAALTVSNTARAAESAGTCYSVLDEIVPAVFDIRTARKLTERLYQPERLLFERGMAWSKFSSSDTPRKRALADEIRQFLKEKPELVARFGEPYHDEDDDRFWKWWEFAVFDGNAWHTFHLDHEFWISLESGSLEEDDSARREQAAAVIFEEVRMAAR